MDLQSGYYDESSLDTALPLASRSHAPDTSPIG